MTDFLQTAVDAACGAGQLLRDNFGSALDVAASEAHDIKLDLDVRAQELITKRILGEFPGHAIYGEEGIAGDQQSPLQWIVDPIDGTVNYFYNIPHFCVSIALREREEIIAGVIYDPMRNELWQVRKNEKPTLNGVPFQVSARTQISEAIVSVGFSKSKAAIGAGLPLLEKLAYRVRKCRMMGSAALDMAYIACGRIDAYIEQIISLWDIAAGKILIESAGGRVDLTPRPDSPDKFSCIASSGRIDWNI
jgi:myo-inositol-1(or 4)-monophosphatase